MSDRNHSKSRSPVMRGACRMSQASTIAASSQPDSLMLALTHLMHGFPLYHSHLEPLCRTSLHRCWRLRLLNPVGPHIVGTHQRRLPRRSRGLLRLFTSRILTLLRVHALQLFSRAWLLLFCPTRDRHLLCPFFLLSVTATTGAANVLAEALPPFLASCDTLRISTRVPLWTRPLAPCLQRSNGSPARLPLVVASEEVELGSAIVVVRPVRLGPLEWETSLWAPSCSCQP